MELELSRVKGSLLVSKLVLDNRCFEIARIPDIPVGFKQIFQSFVLLRLPTVTVSGPARARLGVSSDHFDRWQQMDPGPANRM